MLHEQVLVAVVSKMAEVRRCSFTPGSPRFVSALQAKL
jgi:hypothetical protein